MQTVDEPLAKLDDPWFHLPGFVYFISAGSDCEHCKSIKVGVTTTTGLLRRLRSIQSSNPSKIRLLGVIPYATMRDAEQREKAIHGQFARDAYVAYGAVGYEWFRASPELLDYVGKEAKLPSLDDLPQGATVLSLFA